MPIGIVLGNLGTPKSASVADVRSYLREFLMDPYVINKPFIVRWIVVNLIIAPLRAPKSAAAYASVWNKEGSPLMVFSKRLKDKIQARMGMNYKFSLGMRYGEPSIFEALKEVQGCEKILLAPLYPQYAESSFQTWVDEAEKAAAVLGLSNKIKLLAPFYKEVEYLKAQHSAIAEVLARQPVDHLLFSFHGLPESHLKRTTNEKEHSCALNRCVQEINVVNERCYKAECYFVARDLAKRLGLSEKEWSVSFQSRLGPEPWIGPFTDVVIPQLAKEFPRLAVAMPAFTADCLETIEEIGDVAKNQFLSCGGKQFVRIPCLNDHPYWVERLAELLEKSI